jgi:hypothetical protein
MAKETEAEKKARLKLERKLREALKREAEERAKEIKPGSRMPAIYARTRRKPKKGDEKAGEKKRKKGK